MISERLRRMREALTVLEERVPLFVVELPARLQNTGNARQHWRATAHKAKSIRTMARLAVSCEVGRTRWPKTEPKTTRLAVLLVYIGPKELDDDGVVSACKSLRDGVADALGVDDRDPRVTWVPDQERGGVREYAARVEVYRVE